MPTKEQDPVADSTDIVQYDHSLFPGLVDQDPTEVTARFARRFMASKTLDDLFDVLEGQTSNALVGKALELLAVEWAPYESDRGVIPLAIVQSVELETGERIEFATTGMMLTLFLRQAQLIDAYPFQARIVAKKTRSGQTALNFERV